MFEPVVIDSLHKVYAKGPIRVELSRPTQWSRYWKWLVWDVRCSDRIKGESKGLYRARYEAFVTANQLGLFYDET